MPRTRQTHSARPLARPAVLHHRRGRPAGPQVLERPGRLLHALRGARGTLYARMVRLSAPPRTVLAALPRRQDRFRLRDRTDGIVAVSHLMRPQLFAAFDCATLPSLGRPGPMLAASPRAAGVPLASAAENFDVRRALSAQFRGGVSSGGTARPIAGLPAHLK